MLQTEVVPLWMTKDQFLQGLGLAQSMPGPLFNFSSYLGAVYQGVAGGLVAYVGLFGPGATGDNKSLMRYSHTMTCKYLRGPSNLRNLNNLR